MPWIFKHSLPWVLVFDTTNGSSSLVVCCWESSIVVFPSPISTICVFPFDLSAFEFYFSCFAKVTSLLIKNFLVIWSYNMYVLDYSPVLLESNLILWLFGAYTYPRQPNVLKKWTIGFISLQTSSSVTSLSVLWDSYFVQTHTILLSLAIILLVYLSPITYFPPCYYGSIFSVSYPMLLKGVRSGQLPFNSIITT